MKNTTEIDLFDEEDKKTNTEVASPVSVTNAPAVEVSGTPLQPSLESTMPSAFSDDQDVNDFEITAEELAGIEFVPTAQRMQTVSHGGIVKGNKVNFKTILVKGLMWALIGAFLGFAISELLDKPTGNDKIASAMGYTHLAEYYEYSDRASDEFDKAFSEFEKYCRKHHLGTDNSNAFADWYTNEASEDALRHLDEYSDLDGKADDALYRAYTNEFKSDEEALGNALGKITRTGTAIWSGIIALFIGLLLGIGEGVYYGSKSKALKYAAIGAGISIVMGFASGYLAQLMYSKLLGDDPSAFMAAFIRGLGWAIMGVGIGLAVGLIKPTGKRILFCGLGGLCGAFVGGFLFNYVCDIIPNDTVARAVAIIIMGGLIGVGVGLLEQFAKQAWLKVIRGEFEGKEYLVFAGTTSIGNNGKNTIVLFKDKLVGPHHCDIVLEGSKYVLVDCGTPMGTIVNGMKTSRHVLKQGDAIAIGNSVLVFNTK